MRKYVARIWRTLTFAERVLLTITHSLGAITFLIFCVGSDQVAIYFLLAFCAVAIVAYSVSFWHMRRIHREARKAYEELLVLALREEKRAAE